MRASLGLPLLCEGLWDRSGSLGRRCALWVTSSARSRGAPHMGEGLCDVIYLKDHSSKLEESVHRCLGLRSCFFGVIEGWRGVWGGGVTPLLGIPLGSIQSQP